MWHGKWMFKQTPPHPHIVSIFMLKATIYFVLFAKPPHHIGFQIPISILFRKTTKVLRFRTFLALDYFCCYRYDERQKPACKCIVQEDKTATQRCDWKRRETSDSFDTIQIFICLSKLSSSFIFDRYHCFHT